MLFEGTILWLLPILLLALWIPQNAQHEAAHAVMVKYLGGTVTKFRVLPTRDDDGITFAYVSYRWGEKGRPSPYWDAWLSAAPQLLNTFLLVLLIGARLAFPGMPELLATVLSTIMLLNFVDGAVNLGTFYRLSPRFSTDGWSWQRGWGLPVWACRVGTVLWHLVFGAFVFLPVFLG